ncbi:MAG: hypothetical protein JWP57_4014 [Spirosoma sp.]|nr:hypothetical protein [Spirosoma sp.]
MGPLDAVREAYGASDGLLRDLLLIVGACIFVCILGGFLAMLRDVLPHPRVWPVIAGAFAFWPLALSGRPGAAVAACLGGVVCHALLGSKQAVGEKSVISLGSPASELPRS